MSPCADIIGTPRKEFSLEKTRLASAAHSHTLAEFPRVGGKGGRGYRGLLCVGFMEFSLKEKAGWAD